MEILLKEQNNNQAQIFLSKYYSALGGGNTAEGKQLIEPDRIVETKRTYQQLSSQSSNWWRWSIQDPNVAGKFPSNSVAV